MYVLVRLLATVLFAILCAQASRVALDSLTAAIQQVHR